MQENLQNNQHPENIQNAQKLDSQSSKAACVYFLTQMPDIQNIGNIDNIENINNIEILQENSRANYKANYQSNCQAFLQSIKALIWQKESISIPNIHEKIFFLDATSFNPNYNPKPIYQSEPKNILETLNILSDAMWLDDYFLPNEVINNFNDVNNFTNFTNLNETKDPIQPIQPIILSHLDIFMSLDDLIKNQFNHIYIFNIQMIDMNTITDLIQNLKKTQIYLCISINEKDVQKGRQLYRELKQLQQLQQGVELVHFANPLPNINM